MKLITWLVTLVLAFTLGSDYGRNQPARETDGELRDRVQQHLDVIVDESAAIVDDVTEAVRQNEHVQNAETFLQDAKDVAEETAEEVQTVIDHTKERIDEKFGTNDAASEEQASEGAEKPEEEAHAAEAAPAEDAGSAEPDSPASEAETETEAGR